MKSIQNNFEKSDMMKPQTIIKFLDQLGVML